MSSQKDTGSTVALAPSTSPTNGVNVLSFTLTRPLVGVYILEVEIDIGDGAAPTGAQVFSFAVSGKPPVTYAVYVVESHVHVGRCSVFAVGGAGGMRESIVGTDYGEIAPRLAFEDILAAPVTVDGVARPETGDAAALAALDALPHLARWSTSTGTARSAATRLAAQLGMSWRALPNGAMRIGTETWPAWVGGANGQPYYTEEPDAGGLAELALDAPDLAPGQTIVPPDDQAKVGAGLLRVSDVIHEMSEDGAFRTRIRLVPPEGTTAGASRDRWIRAVRGALPPLGWMVPYGATVVSQDVDGTLGLRLDAGAPLLTLSGVPIWAGWPGLQIKVPSGARCAVEFLGGSELSPIVRSFAPETPVTLVKFDGGSNPFARVGDATHSASALLFLGNGAISLVPRGTPNSLNIDGLVAAGDSKFTG